jgi:hypothetical protein
MGARRSVTITEAQAIVLKLADEGKTPEQIATELCRPTRVIKTQLTRIRRKVAGGAFDPPPLPIEAEAMRAEHEVHGDPLSLAANRANRRFVRQG